MKDAPALKRCIGLTPLILYGVGTMVGGGFYALLGQVVSLSGFHAPVALFVSGVLALLSAASFAELSSRFPVSAGEVEYVWQGFGFEALARLVGWLVIATGVVSAATLAVATVGFANDLVPVPPRVGVLAVVLGLGLVAAWGIGESVGVVFGITVLEVGTLVLIGALAGPDLWRESGRWPELVPSARPGDWVGIVSGASLAFYAFIGFEDMVNIAEEVERPRHNLPVAILVSVTVTVMLYLWVGVVAVVAVEPADVAAGNTPVARLVSARGWYAVTGVGVVSLLTGVNGALVQIIMAARVAYGMARRGWFHPSFGRVSGITHTPLVGTAAMTAGVAVLAMFFPLTTLARATSAIMLVNFTLVNLALWRIKGRPAEPPRPDEGPRLPRWLSLVATAACLAMLLFQGLVLLL